MTHFRNHPSLSFSANASSFCECLPIAPWQREASIARVSSCSGLPAKACIFPMVSRKLAVTDSRSAFSDVWPSFEGLRNSLTVRTKFCEIPKTWRMLHVRAKAAAASMTRREVRYQDKATRVECVRSNFRVGLVRAYYSDLRGDTGRGESYTVLPLKNKCSLTFMRCLSSVQARGRYLDTSEISPTDPVKAVNEAEKLYRKHIGEEIIISMHTRVPEVEMRSGQGPASPISGH